MCFPLFMSERVLKDLEIGSLMIKKKPYSGSFKKHYSYWNQL